MMRNSFLALAAASACLLAFSLVRATECLATTVVRLELPELVARADTILEGRVSSKTVVRTSGRHIATEYVVEVERTFLGAGGTRLLVRLPGGVLPDGSGLLLPGMPSLSVNETALLFLAGENPRGERMPIGLAQGRWKVAADTLGQRTFVRDTAGLEFVDARGKPVPAPAALAGGHDHDAVVKELVRLATLESARRAQAKR